MKKFLTVFVLILTVLIILTTQVNAAERNERDFIGAAYKVRIVNCNKAISLRYSPSVYAERLTLIPLGTIVDVYDGPVWGIDGFYPVEYNGMRGYCLKEYLKYHSDG